MPYAGQTVKPMIDLPRDPAACWLWTGPVSTSGHGNKTFCGRMMLAHRWMWEMLFGVIPKGLVVYHACDRKDGVNPHHLRLGTRAEANRQAVHATLTPADVAEIRRARAGASGETAGLLAARMGVTPGTIRSIWRSASWGRPRPNHGPKRRAGAQA